MNLNDFNLGVFEFAPGRYYVAMWFLNFPAEYSEFGKGGDLIALLWRPETVGNESTARHISGLSSAKSRSGCTVGLIMQPQPREKNQTATDP